jgi:FAD synthase
MKITGPVVGGNKLGRTLGYPTANIAVGPDVVAANGVYAAWVWIDNDGADGGRDGASGEDAGCEGASAGKSYGAMANLGVKPTFSDGRDGRVLEIHLLDFEGDLYGQTLTVELCEFIRPEKKFPTSAALRTQIAKDQTQIERILKKVWPK